MANREVIVTGAAIYRTYDRSALDTQYDNRRRFPHYVRYFADWRARSANCRETLEAQLDLAYGPAPTETLDLFPASSPKAPLYVFIHGGYWQSLDKSDFSYIAQGMVANGVTTAVVNYALAPEHAMDEIVRQNRDALAWLWRNAAQLGVDRDRIYICGHSAGGHLVMMLLATDWPAFGADLPPTLVTGGCSISGIFDLEPIRLCYLNDVLGMDAAQALRNSPLALSYPAPAPLTLVVGAEESEEYHRQNEAMATLWRDLGYGCEIVDPDGLDHFTIVDALDRADDALVQLQLAQMAR